MLLHGKFDCEIDREDDLYFNCFICLYCIFHSLLFIFICFIKPVHNLARYQFFANIDVNTSEYRQKRRQNSTHKLRQVILTCWLRPGSNIFVYLFDHITAYIPTNTPVFVAKSSNLRYQYQLPIFTEYHYLQLYLHTYFRLFLQIEI